MRSETDASERGHDRDLSDVEQLVLYGLIEPRALLDRFDEIRSLLARYPAIDAGEFEAKVRQFVEAAEKP
jgi:hypothetical protein